jgi:glycosyltransferase involved in cell wall biosynthesis
MLKGQNIIYFGPESWEGLWRNRHQLLSVFARENRVLYVEPRVFFRTALQRLRHKPLKWTEIRKPKLTQALENLYIYHPPVFLPISGRSPLRDLLEFANRHMLRGVVKSLGMCTPLIWFSRPSVVDHVGNLDKKLVIYHVVDEYTAYEGMSEGARRRLQDQEQRLLRQADLVIVVSDSLMRAKQPFNKQTYLVPNGVDYPAYSHALDSNQAPPADIAALHKPLIGYSGLIAARLDLVLLRDLVQAHPEWSLVLVGAIDDRYCAGELNELRHMPNVHFLGRKDIDQVPYYIKAFDVCLIPYRVDERAQHASPLKLYDYLAAGKPVVTTDYAAARPFRDVIRIVESRGAFISAVEDCLSEDGRLIVERRRIAADNTWEKRVEQLSCIIESRLAAGQTTAGGN